MNMHLLSALKSAYASGRGSRWRRLARQPVKTVLPFLLRWLGIVAPTHARTFFKRSQKVVLPEPVSTNIWRNGVFEEDVAYFLLICLVPRGVFFDVGGHFGFFSMLGAELVEAEGTVVTFEPMPTTRAVLADNMAKQAPPCRHYLIPAAAGPTSGRLIFKDFGLIGSAFATSAAVRSTAFVYKGEVEVEMRSVDSVVEDLNLKRVDLIKVDAENSEAQVLAGAVGTIERYKPSLILETGDSDGSEARPLIEGLLARGYRAYEFFNFTLRPHKPAEKYGYQNLLFVHSERIDEVCGADI